MECRIYHQDCLEMLSAHKPVADLVLTSPPYNIGKPFERPRRSAEEYFEWQEKVLRACWAAIAPDGALVWQIGSQVHSGEVFPLDYEVFRVVSGMGGILRNRVIWTFGHGLHARKRLSGRYETALWFTKSARYTFNLDAIRIPQKYPQKKAFKGPRKGELSGNPLGKNPGDVWAIPHIAHNNHEKTGHPCQFPLALAKRFILALTNPGDTVLDPFLGSGTSACAALKHGRKFVGCDTSADYVQIAKKRLHDSQCL